jgi:hypothetical protein
MVVVDMKSKAPKTIRKEVCLHAKGHYGLLKDYGPKMCLDTWRREESKEIKDFYEGGR